MPSAPGLPGPPQSPLTHSPSRQEHGSPQPRPFLPLSSRRGFAIFTWRILTTEVQIPLAHVLLKANCAPLWWQERMQTREPHCHMPVPTGSRSEGSCRRGTHRGWTAAWLLCRTLHFATMIDFVSLLIPSDQVLCLLSNLLIHSFSLYACITPSPEW